MVSGLVGLADVVAESVSVGLLVTTADGSVLWSNQAARDLVDSDPSALLAAPGLPQVPGQCRELTWRSPDGARRQVEVECSRLRPEPAAGPALGSAPPGLDSGGLLVLQVTDVTARHELEARAHDRERRLARLEALSKTGSWEWQVASNEVEWSDELLQLCGYPSDAELNYAAYRSHVHPDDIGMVEQALSEALRTGKPFSYTHRMYPKGGDSQRVFECHGEVLRDDSGQPARLLVTAHDVTEQLRIQDELTFLAEHDPLTGLLNRRAVTGRLRDQLAGPVRGGALLLIDVDNFKDVNDLLGHGVGDQVMRSLAELLGDQLARDGAASSPGVPTRVADEPVLGRLAGDEFAVVLPAGDAGDALAVAESACRAVSGHQLSIRGEAVRVTASIGVATLTPAGDPDVLLANADLALNEAKAAGGNQTRLFAPEQYQLAARRVSVLQRVRDALDAGLMSVDAQPIVDLATRRVTSYELLIRLRDGLDPALGPGEFLPPVERTDLVRQLDRWMVQQAVHALGTPRARRDVLCLHVNVSARSLEDPGFGDYVVAALQEAGVLPARLGLEITETAAITNLAAARRLANRLTRVGCRFSLDDFGAGFGSFAYLKHLPFTAVKIDGEFVRQADRAVGDSVFVEAVVTVARGLNMVTIAEYVDREPLVELLTRLGVDRAQGFHLGRPRPLAELIDGD